MDEETMDLDAIDQLAWYRIIQFLDHKSQLHCRSLSPIIKSYVDYMGLQLTIDKLSVLKSPDKDAWEHFLSTPELYLRKVHITAIGNNLQALGITLQHQVEVLKISCFLSLNTIVNASWTRNIVELSLNENALAVRLFEGLNSGPDVIHLPRLKKLILSVQLLHRALQEWREIRRISMRNVATLIRQIRSDYMNLIFVEFSALDGNECAPPRNLYVQLLHALSQSMQSHSKTLQTVILHCYYLKRFAPAQMELPVNEANMEFTCIPYGLKNVDIDFLPCCSLSSPWLKMLSQLNHLEELVGRPENPDESGPNNFMEIIRGVMQNNYRTLKYIELYVPAPIDASPLDLGIFGCCSRLESLQLDTSEWEEQGFFANLPMLPASLKVLNIRGFYQLCSTMSTLAPGEIPLLCKFKNLVEFRLDRCLAFCLEQLIECIKILARLPKLNFIRITEIAISEEGFIENSNQWRGLFETLTEGQPNKLLCNFVPSPYLTPIQILFEGIPCYDSEVIHQKSKNDIPFKQFASPEGRSKIQKTQDEVNGSANLRTSFILPEVTDTRFRIREDYR